MIGARVTLGVSYPWGTGGGVASYGWDFGDPYGRGAAWPARLEADLRALVDVGVRVVRWFVLADGRALGRVGAELRERSPGDWAFTPPHLGPGHPVVEDLGAALRVFRAPGIAGRVRLVPVLVDGVELARRSRWRAKYRPHGPGAGVLAGGRGDAVGRAREAFLSRCLAPLVDACLEARDAVAAIELVNEPEMLGRAGVPRRDVVAFVREGVARLRDRARDAVPVSVGYQYLDGLRDPELGAVAAGVTHPQHHWYGERSPWRYGPLPPAAPVGALGPPVLGELPVRLPPWWPGPVDPRRRSLGARLAEAADRGYREVWLWSAQRAERDPFSRFWGGGRDRHERRRGGERRRAAAP